MAVPSPRSTPRERDRRGKDIFGSFDSQVRHADYSAQRDKLGSQSRAREEANSGLGRGVGEFSGEPIDSESMILETAPGWIHPIVHQRMTEDWTETEGSAGRARSSSARIKGANEDRMETGCTQDATDSGQMLCMTGSLENQATWVSIPI
ncbi:hypothetical protein Salat_2120000 [Sesamum alatum]|uniref:Uncharacterized protein n=1 Tax=Sesamum alatum TaxID=300844 RepID=A0AAE1Y1V8_9LAMI|nr:hypothetical protein Salat_2120000 [Sesamum alatum]